MALRFCDSFDHYATADVTRKWTSSSNAIIGAYGRNGTNGFRAYDSRYLSLTLDAQKNWIVGAAVKAVSFGSSARSMVWLIDNSTTQISAILNGNGTLSVNRGSTELANSGAFALNLDTWYYFEFKVAIGDGDGAYEVRIDGIPRIGPVTSADTCATANETANSIRLGMSGTSSSNVYFDDVYICDGTGAINNDFLGDVQVKCLYPTGAGATTDFTPSAGANYECVNDATLDEADYNSSSTVDHVDTFVFGDIAATGTVLGVQAWADAQKSDTDPRAISLVARPASTDREGSDQTLSTSWLGYRQVWDVNPETSTAWTPASVNASEFGYHLAS